MIKILGPACLVLSTTALAACGLQGTDTPTEETDQTEKTAAPAPAPTDGYDDARSAAKTEASLSDGKLEMKLPDGVTQEMLGERTPQMIAVQVMLDRSAHAPGVIDGMGGGNTDSAIHYYRKAHGLGESSAVDAKLLQSLMDDQSGDIFRTYTVTEKDAAGPFEKTPAEYPQMAKMDALGYQTPLEMFAERFHMDQDFLKALNPDADFGKAGTKLVIVSHGDGKVAGDIAKIEVRKGDDRVAVLNKAGEMIASYPATIGSSRFPSPSGTMEVVAVAPEPNYTFKGDTQDWGPEGTYILPPGPNNPVGGTWIDLAKDGYGIHGSPDPQLIGKTASHGCVRLTNWNAAALAKAVKPGVTVVFV